MKYFRGTLTSICQVQKKRRMKKKKKNFFIVRCVNSSDIFFSYYNLAVNKYIPKQYFQQSLWWQVKFLRKLLILLWRMSPT